MIQKIDIEKLKDKMVKLEEVKSSSQKLKESFDLENQPFVDAKAILEKEISELKVIIGKEAVSHFNETKEKKQLGGVGIQEKKSTVISYTQESALKWAKEKDMFLILDKKAFEKSVPSLNLDFVTIKTDTIPTATFPKEIKLED